MCKPIDSAVFHCECVCIASSATTSSTGNCSSRTNINKALATTVTYCFYYYGWFSQMTDTLVLKIVLLVSFGTAVELELLLSAVHILLLLFLTASSFSSLLKN